ncbi:hypothetical protein [Chenggangzhangella methanolivorans]|uniref:Uncharacterized protein n=1 Tax=Chenggangzhangella methanolivorans TaxID=1437009 RepID=A0A9E6UHL0_9HYPH|nr:hypothetical protein [Chenggangzhangella methanolivorans]QZN99882.1 hypothetical protein K6K41_25105 [Chenggangzhangella methanolivorans]
MSGGRTRAGRAAPSEQFYAFVSQIVGVARTVAPDVADILDPDGAFAATPWRGSRLRGLKLCRSMMRYARDELADDLGISRLDCAIAAVDEHIDELSDERDV